MSADDGQGQGEVTHFGLEARNDGGLGERVREILQRDMRSERGFVNNL